MQGANLAFARDEIRHDHAARSSAGRFAREANPQLFDNAVQRVMAIILLFRL